MQFGTLRVEGVAQDERAHAYSKNLRDYRDTLPQLFTPIIGSARRASSQRGCMSPADGVSVNAHPAMRSQVRNALPQAGARHRARTKHESIPPIASSHLTERFGRSSTAVERASQASGSPAIDVPARASVLSRSGVSRTISTSSWSAGRVQAIS
jgi:hypothetical protein